MGIRKIIHVDMDAFYASVEQRDDPQLRGKPVIVAWKGNRSVVCAASYEARAFGLRSAMPAVRAERLCPSAIFVAPDFTRYRAVSKSVWEIFKRHTDLIEPLSLDEAYLDVTENKTGLPTATMVAGTIRQQIREELSLTASAGVAPNKFLAKLASDWRKPDGLFVIQPEEVDAFLLPLPVGRLPGVGKVTEEKLAKVGIKRWGQTFLADKAPKYSESSVRSMRVALGLTLGWANNCRWLEKNPRTRVKLPNRTGGRRVIRTVLINLGASERDCTETQRAIRNLGSVSRSIWIAHR